MKKFLLGVLALVALLIIGGATFLAVAPPERLLVATNFAAKIVCSNSYMVGRDPQEVLENDIVPVDPSLQIVTVSNDDAARTTAASMLGLFAKARATHTPGAGCRNVYPGQDTTPLPGAQADDAGELTIEAAIDAAMQSIIENDELTGPGWRAVLIMKDGKVVAERYADGFDATTPLLGWSMTKTVTAAIIGRLEQQAVLSRDDTGLFDTWQGDARAQVSVADLLGMASGLEWDEGYAAVSDVTRLLYLEPQPAAYVTAKPLNEADGSRIGQDFNYSSGTSVLLSRYWADKVEATREAGRDLPPAALYPEQALFDPIGMESAVIEGASDAFIGG
ncbi:MAG: serine hydrolase, partial [Pseudomonadota bacterium]